MNPQSGNTYMPAGSVHLAHFAVAAFAAAFAAAAEPVFLFPSR